jgi:hypothetical protein
MVVMAFERFTGLFDMFISTGINENIYICVCVYVCACVSTYPQEEECEESSAETFDQTLLCMHRKEINE